ncbi:MAG TPA: FecR family protein [Flavobacterium sp.]|nr:FecR family protein [Flavobacterium sp.]
MEEQHDLAKWLEGRMTESEREAFEKSPGFAGYDKIRKYSEMLKAPDFDTEKMYRNVMETPKEKAVMQMKTNWSLRIAAVLVLAIGLFFAVRPMFTQTELAPNGTKKMFHLPDHSEVTINSGSEINYKKWGWQKNRCLDLKGEAFFHVTKGKTFDVNTDLGKVTVVGTQFNVKARGDRFEVTCFEGKVRVQSTTETILITKGQSVAYENGKKITPAPVDENGPGWLYNQISFNAENLNAVIAEIERRYDLKITTQNTNSAQKFTGTIPADNMETALQIIASAYHFKYTKTAKNSIIFAGK